MHNRVARTGALEAAILLLFVGGLTAPLWLPAPARAAADTLFSRANPARIDNLLETLTLTIHAPSGERRIRRLELRSRSSPHERTTHVKVLSPPSQQGAQLLLVEPSEKPARQFLLRPSRKQPRLVRSAGELEPILGPDFTLADLLPPSSELEGALPVGDATLRVDGRTMAVEVVEQVAKAGQNLPYTRLEACLSRDGLVRQIRYFQGPREVRRWTVLAYERIGETWLPVRSVMESVEKRTRTELMIDRYYLNLPSNELPASMFSRARTVGGFEPEESGNPAAMVNRSSGR